MARSSRFSLDQRRSAVGRAFGGGERPAAVAAAVGVSVPTLYRWAQAERPSGAEAPDEAATRLIIAAQELLLTASYSDVRVEEVALRAGVPLRTAFHRFESKRVLFGAVVDSAAGKIVAEMGRRASAEDWPDNPMARLQLFLRIAAEAAYSLPESHVLFRDLGVPPGDRFADRWHSALEESLRALLEEAARHEQLRAGLDSRATAQVLARMFRGAHAAVFEGAPASAALGLIDSLHLTLSN